MPGDIVNLKRFRKAKAREDKARLAEENRVRFGQTRAERERRADEETRDARHLDGHRIAPAKADGDDHSGSGS